MTEPRKRHRLGMRNPREAKHGYKPASRQPVCSCEGDATLLKKRSIPASCPSS
ncbi:hypothetical protein HYDPIDRAFT_114426 [Hydnomerulius pinastri MD-312]|uniref:Uncharacterized protein n=1 Tax=Hydnomerulius pinastri MD-312 TaxID=994086 RepID=A0A0C9VAR6_9AGAM|nr:hypothetical protein HYDPIDRAFT_114426 [Hydnomerulius pinastri MD-312]